MEVPYVEVIAEPGIELPSYETPGAAGMDLRSAEDCVVFSKDRTLVRCGIQVAIPEGFEGQVRPRSGLAMKHGLTVLNAPGTIDSDYRGEVCVIIYNAGGLPFRIEKGMRIAQLVIAPVARAVVVRVAALSQTARGSGGFGSTGSS